MTILITKRTISIVALIGSITLVSACGANVTAQPTATPAQSANASGDDPSSPCYNVQDPTNVQVPANGNKQQFAAPKQVIDNSHTYCAILTTEHGRFVMQLLPQYAPQNV